MEGTVKHELPPNQLPLIVSLYTTVNVRFCILTVDIFNVFMRCLYRKVLVAEDFLYRHIQQKLFRNIFTNTQTMVY
jgi:hypothetical protein